MKKILSKNKNIKFIIVGSQIEENIYYNKIAKNIDKKYILNLFGIINSNSCLHEKIEDIYRK